MPLSTGKVANIKYGDDYGFVTLTDAADSRQEIFILWFGDTTSGGPVAMYSMMLALALAQGLTVEIFHDDSSAYIDMLRVLA